MFSYLFFFLNFSHDVSPVDVCLKLVDSTVVVHREDVDNLDGMGLVIVVAEACVDISQKTVDTH